MLTKSSRTDRLGATISDFLRFRYESAWANDPDPRDACDFVLGNPHEEPIKEMVQTLERNVTPRSSDWFAYKLNEPSARCAIVESLEKTFGLTFSTEDIFLTTGAFSGISIVLNTVVDPGDEVIYISPPWFYYEGMIINAGGCPIGVAANPDTFDLDLDSIARAISERTAAIIINSPNNPTGRVYRRDDLEALGSILSSASRRIGREICLISDEAYRRILFDGIEYPSPVEFYPSSFMIYTYSKALLAPGQRIAYIALSPEIHNKEKMRERLIIHQRFLGYAFPNALLQHSIAELDSLLIDVGHLEEKRNFLASELRGLGYRVHVPEGTFYMLLKSPCSDDVEFSRILSDERIYCLPGSIMKVPGYIRISLTADMEMMRRAVPRFARALSRV